MSLDATRWAWQQKVSPMQKLVLLSLADRADESHRCFPSTARLINDTGCHRSTIFESIQTLETMGLLVVKRVLGKGNVFTLVGVTNRHAAGDGSGVGDENKGDNNEGSPSNEDDTSAENRTGSINESSAGNHTGEENSTGYNQSVLENKSSTSTEISTGLATDTDAENHTGTENSTGYNECSATNQNETSTENHTGNNESSMKNITGVENHTSAENSTTQCGKPHYHQCGKPHTESTIESINKLPACQSAENDEKLPAARKSKNAGSSDSIQTLKQKLAADLFWPKCIDQSQREGLIKKLNPIQQIALKQAVLDELAGAAKKAEGTRQIKYPIKLLTTFIDQVLQGEFIPETGIEIRRARERLAADDRQAKLNAEQKGSNFDEKPVSTKTWPGNSWQEAIAKKNLTTTSGVNNAS